MRHLVIRNVGELGPRVVSSRDMDDYYGNNGAPAFYMNRLEWSGEVAAGAVTVPDALAADFNVVTLGAGEESTRIADTSLGYYVIARGSGSVESSGETIPVDTGDCLVVDRVAHTVRAGATGCVVVATRVPLT